MILLLAGCTSDKPQQKMTPADSPLPVLDFPGLQLRPNENKNGHTLIGRARNRSKQNTIQEITLLLSMEDVLASGISTTVATKAVTLRSDILPGQSLDINEAVNFGKLPAPRGRLEWNYRLSDYKVK